MTETYAYFWITDFDEPVSAITEKIGLQPTRVHLKGEISAGGRTRKHSSWQVHSPLPRDTEFLDEHIEALLGVLEPVQESIARIRSRYSVGINCVGYYSGNPGFHLSEALISRCAALRLSIDFDLYRLDEEDSEVPCGPTAQ